MAVAAVEKIDGKKVMVTGGCGLIGSYIVDECLKKDCTVVIVDSLVKAIPTPGVDPKEDRREVPVWTREAQEKYEEKVNLRIGWIQDKEFMRQALQGVEYLFHLAACGGFQRPFAPYFDSNVTGTAVMFDVMHEDGKEKIPVKRIVAASSMAVYGEATYKRKSDGKVFHANRYRNVERLKKQQWEYICLETEEPCDPVAIPEEHPAYCGSAYANSKYFEERMCLTFAAELGIECCCLRYSLTYGPRQSLSNPYTGLISIFSALIMNSKAPIVYEDGKQTRDFVYVEDNAAANIACMETPGTNGQVYNVGWGFGISVGRLADVLIGYFGKQDSIKAAYNNQFRPWDVRHMWLDSSALRKATGWEPKVRFEEGVKQQMQWVVDEAKRGEQIKDYFSEATAKSGLVVECEKRNGGADNEPAAKRFCA